MTPIADAPNSLHTTRSVGRAWVEFWIIENVELASKVQTVEALPEVSTHSVPCFAVRVAYDSLEMRMQLMCNINAETHAQPPRRGQHRHREAKPASRIA